MSWRRALPLLALLALLAGAMVGGARLHAIFLRERGDALAAIEARQRALEQYAVVALAGRLARQLGDARPRLRAAEADPLAPADGLLLRRGEQIILPRPLALAPGDDAPARQLYEKLLVDAPPAAEAGTPWADRLELRARFVAALADGDPTAIEVAFRALLGHRARFVVPAERDVPAVLATLQAFIDRGRPDARLLRALVHDGLQDERGLRVEGLQRQVLRRRGAFTAADFAFLRDRIAALSTRAEAPVDAFLARCAEADAAPPVPAAQAAPALIDAGRWYVEPLEDGLAGLRVDLPAEAAALTDEMRARGLLGAADLVRPLPEAPLPVEVQVPAFAEARDQAEQAFRFKSALLIACGLLVLCVVGLVAADARRRRRYVELKGDFVSAVSHELRTPLASIRLMAETLERRLTGETRARDYPARIVGEVDRLGFLVENILSFNRLDKGRWVARAQPVSLGAVLDQVREALTDAFERPIEWQQQGIDGRTLTADPELLLLLFTNLARNAATYNNRDPIRITVDVQSMGAGCRIRFSDNGRGIPAGAVRHVFTEFYRAPRTAERGSGLGLALCDRIMALHRGRITLAKTSPAGTTFELRFP